MEQGFAGHHKQSRRDPFARDIRNHEPEVVVVNQQIIVKITADLPRGFHRGRQRERHCIGKDRVWIG